MAFSQSYMIYLIRPPRPPEWPIAAEGPWPGLPSGKLVLDDLPCKVSGKDHPAVERALSRASSC